MNEKVLTIVLWVSLGVLVLLGGTGFWYYQFMVLPELDQQIQARVQTRGDLQNKKNEIPVLKKKVKDFQDEITRLSAQIPQYDSGKKENDDFANLVDKLRKKSYVGILDAKYVAPQAVAPGAGTGLPPGVFKATYDFKIAGGFHQLLNFLHFVERDGRFVTVDKVQIVAGNSREEKAGAVALRGLSVTLSTYLARPDAPAPAPAAGGAPGQPTPSPTPAPTPAPATEEKKTSTPSPD